MSDLDRFLREVAGVLAAEKDPEPELASAAIGLAVEALRIAVEALPERRRDLTVVVPVAPQEVLVAGERTAVALERLMEVMPRIELLLYEVDEALLYAEPTRPEDEESGQQRGTRITRAAGAALHGIACELADGSSPLLLGQVHRLTAVEIRKDLRDD